jgi:hypothetical protein
VSDDRSTLGALLELLHRADSAFDSVQATYRIWRHTERAAAAWQAEIEAQRRRGAQISSYGPARGSAQPVEREEFLRIWRSGDRVREKHDGGPRDGSYGVRDGELWWAWDPHTGAISNQDDPEVGSGIGDELSVMLDPTPLLGCLRFSPTGRSTIAGRETVTAQAVARLRDPQHLAQFVLHRLGGGADTYRLEVDALLGVLLEVVAYRDGEPFHAVTAVEIAFDAPTAQERFKFEPPSGEEIQPVASRRRPEHVTLLEAQRRAPFTVLIASRIPSEWRVHCVLIGPSTRPRSPAQVALHYSSDDGHERVSLSQFAAADKPAGYDEMIGDDRWTEVIRDGIAVSVAGREPGASQAQAHIERDGTFVFLSSETLAVEQLATFAAGLKPAPTSSAID